MRTRESAELGRRVELLAKLIEKELEAEAAAAPATRTLTRTRTRTRTQELEAEAAAAKKAKRQSLGSASKPKAGVKRPLDDDAPTSRKR